MLCNNVVFNACKNAELAFNDTAVCVSVLNDLLGEGYVVLVGVVRAVDHDGREAAVDAGLADLEVCAVVEVERKVNAAVLDSCLCESHEVSMLCVLTSACRNLQDNRGLFLCCSLGNRLDDFHVVDVECTDCIVAFVGLLKHLGSRNESHVFDLLKNYDTRRAEGPARAFDPRRSRKTLFFCITV